METQTHFHTAVKEVFELYLETHPEDAVARLSLQNFTNIPWGHVEGKVIRRVMDWATKNLDLTSGTGLTLDETMVHFRDAWEAEIDRRAEARGENMDKWRGYE